MILSLEQLQAAAQGTAYLSEEAGETRFHRFTPEQEALYLERDKAFWKKAFDTAGVKLCFRTDSPFINLTVRALQTKPRTYFALDVAVDGAFIGSIDNFSDKDLPVNYTTPDFELGTFAKRFDLGAGEKTVTLYFPWSVDLRIAELALADGASFQPVRPAKKLLVFGDSITQGYDALHPRNRYAAVLAEALGAEERNKAIGGEVFFPTLAETTDAWEPDYITVAYGTNDWSKTQRETLLQNARAFYSALQQNYPKAKLVALLPIWRKDRDESRDYGSFDQMRRDLMEITGSLGIPAIDCYDFVPKDSSYFADLRLHPNDRGFAAYAAGLCEQIRSL